MLSQSSVSRSEKSPGRDASGVAWSENICTATPADQEVIARATLLGLLHGLAVHALITAELILYLPSPED